jgi:PAS domain S-box-containing protein
LGKGMGWEGVVEKGFRASVDERRRVVRQLEGWDMAAQQELDRVTSLAARVLGVPVALVSLLDDERQWFKSSFGSGPGREFLEQGLAWDDATFCSHTVLGEGPLVVPDARQDERFASNPLVSGPAKVRFYAGAPLSTSLGLRVGALCLLDFRPRAWSEDESRLLTDLAAIVSQEMDQKLAARSARHGEARLRALIDLSWDIITILDDQGHIAFESAAIESVLGYSASELVGQPALSLVHPEDREKVTRALELAARSDGAPAPVSFRFRHRDGSWRVLEAIGRPLRQEDDAQAAEGLSQGMIVSSRDVTERHRAQEALRGEAARLRALAQAQNDIALAALELPHVMERVIFHVRKLTGADGVAVLSMRDNGPDGGLVASAGNGTSAPRVGHELWGPSSLSARCLRENRVLRSDDALADPRVDAQAARATGARSLLAVPLHHGTRPMWVLLASSHRPGAFGEREEQTIELLRGLCSAVMSRALEMADRQAAREALTQSEERFKNAFEFSSTGMALVSPEGRWLQVNPSLCEIVGYSASELAQISFQELTHPDDLPRDQEMMRRLLEGEVSSYQAEKRYRHKDGRLVWVLLNASLVRGADGRPVHFVSQIQDITARKRSEERLRLLESVAVTANDSILITEAEPVELPGPRVLYANRSFTEMSGYSLEEVIGQTPRILQGPDTAPESRQRIRDALKKWEPIVEQLLNYRKDGTPFWVELSIVPVADETGWYTHWVSIQRDISERKAAEDALQSAMQEAEASREEAERQREAAERANAAKSEFLSRMSHELRTPLNAIIGFGQLLEGSPLSQEDQENAGYVVKAGRHLLLLINEVLDIARIEAGRLSLSLEPVEVRGVCAEALSLVGPMATDRGLRVRNALEGFEGFVRADRQRLKQILLNLLSNAVKYNSPNGEVALSWEQDGEMLRVCVSDSGGGIAPQDTERLFTPFERLGASTQIEGSGMGLALSRRLAQAMGGQVGLRSVVGTGSTFWVELPLAQDPLAQPQAPVPVEPEPQEVSQTRHTVLYIEDNQSNLHLVQRVLLRRPHIDIVSAADGEAGLDLARRQRPDLILLDLNLPELPGDEVLRRLRQDPETAHTPVIIVSADATPHQIERLLEMGAQGYLTKPFDLRHFLATLDELLGPLT